MESKSKNNSNDYNYSYCRYNSTKVKPNINNLNNINKDLNKKRKNEITNINNNNDTKKTQLINDNSNQNKINEIKFNLNDNIINAENNTNSNNILNPIQEQIIKLKLENEKIRNHVDKKGKLINDLKDRCNEQKGMINELIKKIENIKKFIPENSFRKDKESQKEKDKLEEQLAIAAVEEQIMKEICSENGNQATMEQIYGKNDSKENNEIKDKIMKIPQIYYEKNKYENSQCSICIDEFKESELLKQLKCGHVFHKECLSQWLLNINNCPFCNKIC